MTRYPLAALALLLFPAAVAAQLSLGLRAGYALPYGDLQKDSKLEDQLESQVPIQLDVMYRVTPRVSAGLYASYGFDRVAGTLKDSTALLVGPGASYRAATYRVGLQAAYAFLDGPVVPWIGVGSGIEVGTFRVKNGGAEITGDTRGWEWVNLQAGGDYVLARSFALGVYASWGVGQYAVQSGEVSGTGFADGSSGGGLGSDAATHSWLAFGLRGRFDL